MSVNPKKYNLNLKLDLGKKVDETIDEPRSEDIARVYKSKG